MATEFQFFPGLGYTLESGGPGLPLARNRGASAEALGSLDSRFRGNDKHPFSVSVPIAWRARLSEAKQHRKEGKKANADQEDGDCHDRRLHTFRGNAGDWRERVAPQITKAPPVLPNGNDECQDTA